MTHPSPIRWGILGTGQIAQQFVQALRLLPDAQVGAIASRTLTTAQTVARQLNIAKAYGSYEELVQDPAIDVVYIATPHVRHKDDCILCLTAGKPVLCEKPFALNAQEAQEVVAIARERQLFCMEAMWMRFIPLMQKVRELVTSGAIGEIRMLTADFGYAAAFDPANRLFNRELGGGALLDRGIYPLSLAFWLLGQPTDVVSQATLGSTGVDEQAAILLNYAPGQLAMLSATTRSTTANEAVIVGTTGQIKIHAPFYRPYQLSVSQTSEPSPVQRPTGPGGLKQKLGDKIRQNALLQTLYLKWGVGLRSLLRPSGTTLFDPPLGNGYQYEAAEVMRCLRQGKLESPTMPLDETLAIMALMDQIRAQWGLRYPQEDGQKD